MLKSSSSGRSKVRMVPVELMTCDQLAERGECSAVHLRINARALLKVARVPMRRRSEGRMKVFENGVAFVQYEVSMSDKGHLDARSN